MAKVNQLRTFLIVGLAWLLALSIGLKYGAVTDLDLETLIQLRLPRVLLASAVGMGLAVSGAVLQALFCNPLCEPYTLGISSGSALGAVIGSAVGIQWFMAGIAAPAFLGAFVFAGILLLISYRPGSTNFTLLLAGVMLGFLGSSLVALLMALFNSSGIQGALFWILGDLSRARLSGSIFAAASVIFLTLSLWLKWRDLDALLMGEEGASALGVDVPRARRTLILTVSLMIGICVSASGMIGFVGLVIPHFARQWVGSLHRRMIPLCALLGATALILSDMTARIVARPYELPVGVVTALLGAPIFLWIMLSRRAPR